MKIDIRVRPPKNTVPASKVKTLNSDSRNGGWR